MHAELAQNEPLRGTLSRAFVIAEARGPAAPTGSVIDPLPEHASYSPDALEPLPGVVGGKVLPPRARPQARVTIAIMDEAASVVVQGDDLGPDEAATLDRRVRDLLRSRGLSLAQFTTNGITIDRNEAARED